MAMLELSSVFCTLVPYASAVTAHTAILSAEAADSGDRQMSGPVRSASVPGGTTTEQERRSQRLPNHDPKFTTGGQRMPTPLDSPSERCERTLPWTQYKSSSEGC